MARVAIIVEFTIKPGCWAAFDRVMREHARRTLETEPGCERFDVLQPLTDAGAPDEGRVMLCEVYASDEDFAAHSRQPRLAEVRAATGPLLAGRVLTRCRMD
jgi:quinol monooxygenase YgiN